MHMFFENISARLPLIQSPMVRTQDEELAIAVALAGGVGSIPCAPLVTHDAQQHGFKRQ